MSDQTYQKQLLMAEYKQRINRVIDYIQQHLSQELTLDELSRVANFSKYHFHRIFTVFVGEPIFKFIQRLRIEKAANMLLLNPKKSIADIAYECGFSSQSIFARTFKDYFKMPASEWRNYFLNQSKQSQIKSNQVQLNSNQEKDISSVPYYNKKKINCIEGEPMKDFNPSIQVEEMPTKTVAYVRHIGGYQGNEKLFEQLFGKLFNWAMPRGLFQPPKTELINIYYDDPELTEDDKLRVDVCMTVPADTQVEGEIGKTEVPAGKYAVINFQLATDEYGDAWKWVFGKWLPESGYQCDDRPSFELYPSDHEYKQGEKNPVAICIPVKPL